jgi:arylsulfatase A-like enzyme
MRFSSGYAAAPVCSPTRYSIQFGKTPARLLRTRSETRNRADHSQESIAEVLKRIDPSYRTAHLGKWHIDADPGGLGYDVHDGITDNKAGGFVNDNTQWHGTPDADPKRVHSLTSRAIRFIEETLAAGRPFFLQLSHYAVHSNIEYSEESLAHFEGREAGSLHTNVRYAAMIRDLDVSIGALLDAYSALGLAANTYILFVSDNGGMPVIPMQLNRGRPYRAGLNSPLLRGKWDLSEGGIRVPFFVVGPGVDAGAQSDTPVVTYDLLPTLADLAGASVALPPGLDGGSLVPVLGDPTEGVRRSSDSLIFHFPHYNRVGMNEPHSAIRSGDFKLMVFPVSQRSLLFDLSRDAGERVDLSEQMPDLKQRLSSELAAYLRGVGAERPEDGTKWVSVGKRGQVRTQFFERYTGE